MKVYVDGGLGVKVVRYRLFCDYKDGDKEIRFFRVFWE